MDAREEIRAQLTGPGGPFEMIEEEVLGERFPIFANRMRSLRELLEASAVHGDKTYIVDGDERISFEALQREVASVAHGLRERYGIGPGDRVAILAANCSEWVLAFWATVSLGGVVAALNGWWTADEIRYGVEHSDPKLLIGDRKRLARVDGEALGVPRLEIESEFASLRSGAPEAALPTAPIAEDDPAVILYTSGTTGRPKGAVCTHRGLVGFVQCNTLQGLERVVLAAKQGAAPSSAPPLQPCSLVTVPLFHLSGLFTAGIMMLPIGGKTVYREGRFDPEEVLRLIEQEQVTMWSALGDTGHRVITHERFGRYDVSTLSNVGFGGAPTSPETQEQMRKAFPASAHSMGAGYGLSESAGLGASAGAADLMAHPTAAGRPTVGHEIEIRDAAGRALPEGREGEIHIRSPYLMLGYWRNPEATAETIKPGRWLATGDIGRLEGGYLFINSRARDMILRGAENIYPVEIEHRLEAHPKLREVAVVGVDHATLGQEVKAIVVPAEGASPATDELAAWVGETLASYKVPSQWEIRAEPLPRNATGKVLKNVLTGESANTFVEE